MQLKEQLLGFFKLLRLQMREMQRYWFGDPNEGQEDRNEKDSILEAQRGRRFTRRGADSQVRHLWDAPSVGRAVEKTLRRGSIRADQEEAAQRREERIRERSIRLRNLSKHIGWTEIVLPFIQKIERHSYYNLAKPHSRQGTVYESYTDERYAGLQEGRLQTAEDIRNLLFEAEKFLKKAEAMEKDGRSKQKAK